MTNRLPPRNFSGTVKLTSLPAGTILHRVQYARYPLTEFKLVPSHRYYGGGRFDSTDDDHYGFMYAGTTVEVAIAESLLRDYPPDEETGIICVPLARLKGRVAGSVQLNANLEVVDLVDLDGLRSVAQSTWLTVSDPRDYAQTRHWGHWIRKLSPKSHGFIWRSRREPAGMSLVLFDSALPPTGGGVLAPTPDAPVMLDREEGRVWLRKVLARYNATVS